MIAAHRSCPRLAWAAVAGLAAGLIAGCGASAPEGAVEGAQFEQRRYVPATGLQRDYFLYRPTSKAPAPALVVYLHGCNQTADDAALGARWNVLAEAFGFVVVYPEQRNPNDAGPPPGLDAMDGNGARCWNWFLATQQQRESGEPAAIVGITREVMAREGIDPRRVYIAGASAGAIMAATVGVTHAELYAAVGMLAGCGYPACLDPSGTLAAEAMRPHARRLPAIVFHGSADEAAPIALGVEAVLQWLGTHDALDDGAINGSVPRLPASTEHVGLDASALAGLGDLSGIGDLCLGNGPSPCFGGVLGFEDQYPYSVQHYLDAAGAPLLDFWIIHGLTHNYPGGDPQGSFTDPLGPDITRAAWDFFSAHPKPD